VIAEDRPEWMDDAACRGVDPDVFYPVTTTGVKRAQQYCDGCPVRVDCLMFAINLGEEWGIWGGLTERDRRRIRRGRTRITQTLEAS
jgi:WhiB family redox-sensing transcriptional regulator